MSIVSAVIDPVLSFHGWPAYAVVGALVFGEAAIFIGFVLPGETAVVIGGVLAYRHSVSLSLMAVLVVVAAIAGDSVGYEVGRRYGNRLLSLKVFAKHQGAIDGGKERLHRLGGRAVFIGRFSAFLRAVMPGMAGTVGLRYRTFLVWNAAGGILWAAGFTVLGYLAGASYTTLESYASALSWVILGLVALAVVVFVIRRRRAGRAGAADDPTAGADASGVALDSPDPAG